ncbi:MAG TPA: hypothetical protein ENN50_00490 [Prosthecochloris aestuarii]|uniref:YXWGXW repeat-containing protein n=1 Tax=Prosthecochloris aestuarii TaxID=1102 RepID=A0A831SQF8_PROAE|nr:hypothetical protein [Prosthecochloris sp.]HED30180.1 hypothetical protein [Prosthecochloris aestuarii]
MKNTKLPLVMLCLAMALPLESCVVSQPARPGRNFVWVTPYTAPGGVVIHGHWKYVGPPQRNRVWIPGHYTRNGHWVRGHWKTLKQPRRHGAVWVPGWRTPDGRWHSGHWRYR